MSVTTRSHGKLGYAPLVYGGGQLAYRAGQQIGKRVGQYIVGNSTKKPRSNGSGSSKAMSSVISTQFDQSMRYRRRSMPRRKRKAWKKFTKKVQHVALQMQPCQSFTNDNPGGVITVTTDQQLYGSVVLGGTYATNGQDLVFGAFKAAYGSALTSTTVEKYRLFIKSMCCDLQIVNTGATAVLVDMYSMVVRKNYPVSTTLDAAFTTTYNAIPASAGGLGTVDVDNPSVTPFNNSEWLQYFKINSKKEILLGAGQLTTLQLRSAKNRYLSGRMLNNNLLAPPGSQAFFFMVRGIPENSAGTARLAAGTISWKAQLAITYAIPPGDSTSSTAQV